MSNDLDFSQFVQKGGLYVPKRLAVEAHAGFGGRYTAQHIRAGKVIDEWSWDNLIVNQGLNHILSTEFNGGTPITTWYLGLFKGNYTPVATDTAANITANSTEILSTDFTEAIRQTWVIAAPASQAATNAASKATFTINASITVYGAFLVSASACAATTGTLMSAAAFSASKAVVATDQIVLTYAFAASSV